jgi:hypothetical protein
MIEAENKIAKSYFFKKVCNKRQIKKHEIWLLGFAYPSFEHYSSGVQRSIKLNRS